MNIFRAVTFIHYFLKVYLNGVDRNGVSKVLKLELVLFSVYLCFLIHYYYLRTEKVEQIHKKRRFIFLILGNGVAVISWSPWFKAFQGWQGWSPLKGKCLRLIKYLLYILQVVGHFLRKCENKLYWHNLRFWTNDDDFFFFSNLCSILEYLLVAIIYKIHLYM